MKKTLIAASLLSAFACGAYAADVQVYGLIDTSLSFVSSDADTANSDRNNSLTMENAQQYGSRFGLRGSEDLGNGMKVSFVLENGFKSDSGELDGELFGREANLTVSGDFGALSIGRMPIFGSVLGANGLFRAVDPVDANYTKAFGSGYATASLMTRVDNAISYKTPTFAGFTGYAMYSTKMDQKNGAGEENEGSADRYASLAARYQAGSLEAILVADRTMYSNVTSKNVSDGKTVTIGGNYTLPNGLKFLTFYQWFDSQRLDTKTRAGVSKDGITTVAGDEGYGFVDGFGVSFGMKYPVGNGVAKFGINYRDMDNQNDVDFKRFTTSAGYDYLLSKRTTAYVMGGYSREKVENNQTNQEATPNGYQVVAGLIHRF